MRPNHQEAAPPKRRIVGHTLRLTMQGEGLVTAATAAAGEYVPDRLDWCWSYGTAGGIYLFAASIQGYAVASYPILHLTYANLRELQVALDAALAGTASAGK